MNWKKSSTALPLMTFLTVGATGCMVDSPQAPSGRSGELPAALRGANVEITNDPAVLESRIERSALPIFIRPHAGQPTQVAEAAKDNNVQLTLVGTVRPPVVDGHVVQANDVEIRDHLAIIAYNFAGETFAGAVSGHRLPETGATASGLRGSVPRGRRQRGDDSGQPFVRRLGGERSGARDPGDARRAAVQRR
jgi:hypothetical protein